MSKMRIKSIIKCLVVAASILGGLFLLLKDAYTYQVKRVVRGSLSFPSAIEAGTFDISTELGGEEMNTSSSLLFMDWSMSDEERNKSDHFGLIDDPTHLLFGRWSSGTTSYLEWELVEFNSGVSVIAGATVVPETTLIKNITLPRSVNLTRAFPVINWRSSVADNANDEINEYCVKFRDNETLQFRRIENATANNEISYQVVEFDRDVNVLNGTTNITAGNYTVNQTISTIDASKSLLIFTVLPGSTSINGIEGDFLVDGYIVNNTTLRFSRGWTLYNVTAYWYVAEFQNNAFTKSGRAGWITTDTNENVTFADSPKLNLSRTAHLVTTSNVVNATNQYEDSLTGTKLVNNGTAVDLCMARNATGQNINTSYSVIEFPPLDVLIPNGNENWTVGQTNSITWKISDSSKNHTLDLRLCKSGCSNISNYTTLIASNVNATEGSSYMWNDVPAVASQITGIRICFDIRRILDD